MPSIYTFTSFQAPNGLPGWRMTAGSAVLGSIFNPGRSETNPNTWYGVAPDGIRFEGTSRDKVADKIAAHIRRTKTGAA